MSSYASSNSLSSKREVTISASSKMKSVKSLKSVKSVQTTNTDKKKSTTTNSVTFEKKGKCQNFPSPSSSHTKYYGKKPFKQKPVEYEVLNSDQYLGISESLSGSSDTFECVHGPEGKQYSKSGLLKRNLTKNIDPIKIPLEWTEKCNVTRGWDLACTLAFLVNDDVGVNLIDRIVVDILDLVKIASNGYRVDVLHCIVTIIDYVVENLHKDPRYKDCLELLLRITQKPLLLTKNSDILTHFEDLGYYIGFLGYLLQILEDDHHFEIVSKGLIGQLSTPDTERIPGSVQRRNVLSAGCPMLLQATSRVLAVAMPKRFAIFLEIAILITCNDASYCMDIIDEDILENLFYRFNPYFPIRKLPLYDVGPSNPQDPNVKLGDSSVHIQLTLSLLLVILKTAAAYLDQNPEKRRYLPCPDEYAQRCYIWAFRYECRARGHKHQRNTLVAVTMLLLHCFRERLTIFGNVLMPDVVSLAVSTELPPRTDWTGTVKFSKTQQDVQFKKMLIHLCVYFAKIFPDNCFFLKDRYWVVGLMHLLDPGLSRLRAHWSPALFAEIRTTSLEALVCIMPYCPVQLIQKCGLIRRYSNIFGRIMWYIEWYSENPFEIGVLYWCMRLLHAAMRQRHSYARKKSIHSLFDSHGVIIIIKLCETLLDQKQPPVEKSQIVISLCLRMLTSCTEAERTMSCNVYQDIQWPGYINKLTGRMLKEVLTYLDKCFIISDRWLIALLNFIWEGVIWRENYRKYFTIENGIYKLLDLITVTRPSVQCLALAILCDLTRTGLSVPQIITWRACLAASKAHPTLVKHGASIASLLAAVFRDDCRISGVKLDEYDVIQDLNHPIMSSLMQAELEEERFLKNINHRTLACLTAAEMAGSRMSKAYALMHMLSEDLAYKVEKADQDYNLYKNVKLPLKDEVVLILCAHYLTLKLCETWTELKAQNFAMVTLDEALLDEFIYTGRGWAKEIKLQQEKIIAEEKRKEELEENSLYTFLGRVRLNIALDALRDVRCVARSADRNLLLQVLLHETVMAHHRSTQVPIDGPRLKTFVPALDDQNITGQYITLKCIETKEEKIQESVEEPKKKCSVGSIYKGKVKWEKK